MILKSTPGFWSSTIEPRHVQNQPPAITFLTTDQSDIYWAEQRPAEGGRTTIMRQRGRNASEVIPRTAAIGSKIHGGYGGAPFCVSGGVIYFIGKNDQRIYQSDDPLSAVPITVAGPRFCGITLDTLRSRLIGVMEQTVNGREVNSIVSISILTGVVSELYGGADFVGEPYISPDGSQVAFLTWNLPHMAWEESRILVGRFGADGSLSEVKFLPHQPGESHAQPIWSPSGELFYSSDRSGYWNVYRRNHDMRPIHPYSGESSMPLWNLGVSQYAFRNDYKIVVSYQVKGLSQLWEINLDTGATSRIQSNFSSITSLRTLNGEIVAIAASASSAAKIILIGRDKVSEIYSSPSAIKEGYFTVPQAVEFAAKDCETVSGLYYAPQNPSYKATVPPPTILMIHGGPTNCAVPELSMRKLYFTSRGFGVFDLNYRGSSGFGRRFRERLNRQWMVADVEDCVSAAETLISRKLSSTDLFIRGSSAGGATALLALSKSKIFKGAAAYYPVVNLADISHHSPKFESGYLVSLIGPESDANLYKDRSPITWLKGIRIAPTFFHGLEDRVCLPSSTIAYVDALKANGFSPELQLYPGEGHGFRSGEVLSDALDKELKYYQQRI